MLATTAVFALLTGGGVPTPTYPRPAITPTVSALAASQPAILSMPLQLGQHCPKHSSVCTSGEPSLSLTQIRTLAKVFGLKVMLTPASKDAAITLQLSNPAITSGLAGIGMPALFIKKGEPYYTASNILGLVSQTSQGAYYTATPHLQLHTEHATLVMGTVPAEKLRLFFAGLAFSIVETLLPETFTSAEPCNPCATFGVTSVTQSDLPAKRLHTNLASGQVVLLLTYNLHSESADTTPYVTAAGLVKADGWVSFPLDKLPARMVTDPALLKPEPANNGNGLLLRVTNTPLNHLSEGVVPLK